MVGNLLFLRLNISERTSEIDIEMAICFDDRQLILYARTIDYTNVTLLNHASHSNSKDLNDVNQLTILEENR